LSGETVARSGEAPQCRAVVDFLQPPAASAVMATMDVKTMFFMASEDEDKKNRIDELLVCL